MRVCVCVCVWLPRPGTQRRPHANKYDVHIKHSTFAIINYKIRVQTESEQETETGKQDETAEGVAP